MIIAADEQLHAPGADAYWQEQSFYFNWADPDGRSFGLSRIGYEGPRRDVVGVVFTMRDGKPEYVSVAAGGPQVDRGSRGRPARRSAHLHDARAAGALASRPPGRDPRDRPRMDGLARGAHDYHDGLRVLGATEERSQRYRITSSRPERSSAARVCPMANTRSAESGIATSPGGRGTTTRSAAGSGSRPSSGRTSLSTRPSGTCRMVHKCQRASSSATVSSELCCTPTSATSGVRGSRMCLGER